MVLPFFYKQDINLGKTEVVLDEATSKHMVQVLRMQNGEQLQLTDGKGNLFTCKIIDNNRKRCTVMVLNTLYAPIANPSVTIAISLLKNNTRFEWFLEKATEIGVTEIIPLICERTEKTSFKYERMKSILISAMLQSQQCWLPVLQEPIKFANLLLASFNNTEKYIAHCEEVNNNKKIITNKFRDIQDNSIITKKLILIGPEGDFTSTEIELALKNNFVEASLGNTRLRTETAGVVAATFLIN